MHGFESKSISFPLFRSLGNQWDHDNSQYVTVVHVTVTMTTKGVYTGLWRDAVSSFFFQGNLADCSSRKVKLKLSLCLIKHCHEYIWGSGGIGPPFLTSALDGGEWSASRPGVFIPGTHLYIVYAILYMGNSRNNIKTNCILGSEIMVFWDVDWCWLFGGTCRLVLLPEIWRQNIPARLRNDCTVSHPRRWYCWDQSHVECSGVRP
jgi:hypothetical protein